MANHQYDAVVVGARCAGSPTAFDAAMAAYQTRRDTQVLAMYELTTQLATFAQVMGGVMSPAEFFSEENVGRLLTMAH